MAFFVDPLIKKIVQIATGGVLEGLLQVLGDDVLSPMANRVKLERLEKKPIAEQAPKHVQHQAALFVQMAVEQLDWRLVAITHDRPAIMVAVLGQIALTILLEVPSEFVRPQILFAPQRLE